VEGGAGARLEGASRAWEWSGLANNPLNLGLRFALEIAGLVCLGMWGWSAARGVLHPLLAIGVPLMAAAMWGTFRVPDDPGRAPVAVPGAVRLLIEAAYFVGAVLAAGAAVSTTASLLFAVVVALHYLLSYDRVISLLRR